ncbi:hypothetical protein [Streptomyces sp. CBMA156]|uniref:hypothetical protein n=1 Tax=Streptomyces sp. CBMA156 TaxID=1930280 RepID=UPI001661B7A5|nr:hypothetical protein [Streptomyces sp. CBMA156]MBD0672197.1 hypothetical protein [Streptomyces sp. CBMA156]
MALSRKRALLPLGLLVAAACAVGFLLGGPGSGPGSGSGSGSGSGDHGAGTSADGSWTPQQDQVRQRYLAYWDGLLQANANGDADAPALAGTTASNQLNLVRQNVTHLRDQGAVARGTVGHAVRGISVQDGVATLVDCVDIRAWIQYDLATGAQRTGQLIDRPNQLTSYTLALKDGQWMVTDSKSTGTC